METIRSRTGNDGSFLSKIRRLPNSITRRHFTKQGRSDRAVKITFLSERGAANANKASRKVRFRREKHYSLRSCIFNAEIEGSITEMAVGTIRLGRCPTTSGDREVRKALFHRLGLSEEPISSSFYRSRKPNITHSSCSIAETPRFRALLWSCKM